MSITALQPSMSRTHSWNWKPHPYTLPKRSVGVGSHFMVMSALYRYHADLLILCLRLLQ